MLQHGSVVGSLDLGLHARLFGGAEGEAAFSRRFAAAAAGLGDVVSPPPARAALAKAVPFGDLDTDYSKNHGGMPSCNQFPRNPRRAMLR